MTPENTTLESGPSLAEPAAPRRLWSGMIAFASFMLLLAGGFHVIGGFVALLEDDHYNVDSDELMVTLSYGTWSVLHMALGVGMFLAGAALFFRKSWARVVAVVVAALSALNNLVFLSAAPGWFGLMILLDILIIYAVTVHYDDELEFEY